MGVQIGYREYYEGGYIKEDEIGAACSTYGELRNAYKHFNWKT
jgi:hypothetical protein